MSLSHQLSIISQLSQEALQALLALYSVEQRSRRAAFVVDNTVGIWLCDLAYEGKESISSELGLYTVDNEVFEELKQSGLLQRHKPFMDNDCNKVENYRLVPRFRDTIAMWLIANEVTVPVLAGFSVKRYFDSPSFIKVAP